MKPHPQSEMLARGTTSSGTGTSSKTSFLYHSTTAPSVPDHELLRCIGRGSYGDVWLARNVLGELRAVKVVYRDRFEHERPYEREFEGIRKFEPISRLHESQVDILHVGRNDEAGFFYYVMELADDANAPVAAEATKLTPSDSHLSTLDSHAGRQSLLTSTATYQPHTLKLDLHCRGRLSVEECLHIGLELTTAVQHLHEHGLVHRDIKPSNIIFVGGVPKLADIGLVASMDQTMSFVGTSGFLPPEGPGTPQADIYSLGKVLYEICMGRDRTEFPKLPPELIEGNEGATLTPPVEIGGEGDPSSECRTAHSNRLLELNAVILKACDTDPRQRYQSAQEMAADLVLLQRGQSVKRKRTIQRRWTAIAKLSFVAALITLMAGGALLLYQAVNRSKPGDSGEWRQLEMKGTRNREAWNAYITGLRYYQRETADASKRAIEYLKEATRLDPKFAQPYAALAEICRWNNYLFSSEQEAMSEGKKAALQAVALDDSLAQAHKELGYFAAHLDRDFAKATNELQRAIKLSPNYSNGHGVYAWLLLEMRRFEEAKQETRLALRLDPAFTRTWCTASIIFRAAGEDDEALGQLRRALDLDPNYWLAFEQLGDIHEEKGEFLEAIEMFRKAAVAHGAESKKVAQMDELQGAFSIGGAQGYWQKRLELADRGGDLYDLAVIYLHLGQKDAAFECLGKVEEQKSASAFHINFDRRFDNVRSDPRFHTLLRKLGLENSSGTTHGETAR